MHSVSNSSGRKQQGAATLLFILIAALAMIAATASTIYGVSGSQKMQYTEHVSTQAEMSAWSAVSVLSDAVKLLPANSVLTANQAVQLNGMQAGVSAVYMGKSGSNLLFKVTGTSAGANSILMVAISPATSGGGGGGTPLTTTVVLNGPTTIRGSVAFTGSTPLNLSVVGGDLSLQGSVTGLGTVCTTGNLNISSAISVVTACANGDITLTGSANATNINAGGNVLLQGGASSVIGTVNANGYVNVSGGGASAGTINSGSYVTVSGGGANVGTINALGYINWTGSNTATALNANGDVTYTPSANPANTTINSLGKVSLTAAKNVNALGAVTLTGYYGQGVTGVLNSGGLLSGSSWGANGGNVVASGTVASIVSPYPTAKVKVTVTAGYVPTVASVSVTPVPTFSASPITVDVYPLVTSSNYVFTGVDTVGNPKVSVANVKGVPNGNYFIAKYNSMPNYLCASVSGTSCSGAPLMKICQGQSDYNECFSYTKLTSTWGLDGKQLQPGVFWFQGNASIGNGNWVATFLASGNVAVANGSVSIFSPNYVAAAVTCAGAADAAKDIEALSSFTAMSGSFYPTQLCSSSSVSSANAVGNVAIIAGGYSSGVFSGGTITLGASTKAYGSVLAGQYLNTGGSTTMNGLIYAAGQGAAGAGNGFQGSTSLSVSGGSSTYNPGTPPCMSSSCATSSANNIVWVGPL